MLNLLNTAQTGLSAAQTAVDNASNNIVNQNTPGYKKRVVQLSELAHLDNQIAGRGVSADLTYRITSQYTYDRLIAETTKSNYFDETSRMLGNIEIAFQETDESGFSHDLNRFFQAIEDLRSNPNSEIYQTTFQNQGEVLVDSLKNLYEAIENEEAATKLSLEANVDKVNNILSQIGDINEQLGQHHEPSLDLLDKRDALEKELAQYVDIEVDRTDGEYELRVSGQVAVRHNTNVRHIEVEDLKTPQTDRFVTTDAAGNTISNINENGNLDNNDVITYKLDNGPEVSVKLGEYLTDANGNTVDLNGDGIVDTNDIIDDSNYVRALVHEINHHPDMIGQVKAYNGNPALDENGNKVDATTVDKFLVVEAVVPGEEGQFSGRITVTEYDDPSDPTKVTNRDAVYKDEYQSAEAKNEVNLKIYDSAISIKSGILKAQTENLTTDAPGNKFVDYKEKLDSFAGTLSDIFSSFAKTGSDEYLYGEAATDAYNGDANISELNLFSGSDVKSLQFNASAVNDLNQSDLDYMSQVQWKKDISFTGQAQDPSADSVSSFSEFFQDIKINISSDKESNDFLLDTQETVEQSIQSSYDQLTKVDDDEEMLNLMKFQAAYTSSAKIVTVADEMLQTLLGIR